jgi:hypothetical protein
VLPSIFLFAIRTLSVIKLFYIDKEVPIFPIPVASMLADLTVGPNATVMLVTSKV